jgi:hypothetical protein
VAAAAAVVVVVVGDKWLIPWDSTGPSGPWHEDPTQTQTQIPCVKLWQTRQFLNRNFPPQRKFERFEDVTTARGSHRKSNP